MKAITIRKECPYAALYANRLVDGPKKASDLSKIILKTEFSGLVLP